MKNFFYSMLALTLSVFAFTSCEDVPAPYATPEVDNGGVYIDQSFASSLSPFVSYLAEGTPEGMHWTNAYSSAVCTGSYKEEGASARTNHAGTAWLVGPTVDLSGASKIRVSFDQAVAYERTDGIADHHEFLVSTDYVEGNDPSTATWQKLNITFSSASHSGGNFDFEQTGLNLDPSLLVENVTFAFRYTSTEANASTWEVKNLLVMEGEYTAPTDGGEVVAYTKATGITAGQQYVFVAKDGDAYVAAAAKDGNYGYLNKADVELVDGAINVKDEQKFTFEQAEGGYYIKDANGKYLYMTGTYNSFNFSADVPAEGGVWTVNFTDNGVHVVNVAMQKTIQYSSQYGSWGAYATVTNILPELYTGGETGGESGEGGQGGGQTSGDHGTTQADPLTVAEALTIINGLADGATTDTEYFIKGKTTADGSTFYFNATYGQCNYYISADGSDTNTIYVYNGLGLNNEKFTAKPENWGKGSEVLIKGKLQKYVKDSKVTPEIARGNYVVSVTPATPGESGGEGGEGGGTSTGTGVEAFTNGGFESWDSGLPVNWKSASTASSASLSQSTDAHSGSYSVLVGGTDSANKRLGYKEMTLPAGTYVLSCWAKRVTDETKQIRLGYVPVTDGTAGSYAYDSNYLTLDDSTWKSISYEFTLSAETTICLVVMNCKKSNYSSGADVLIDDVTLVKK